MVESGRKLGLVAAAGLLLSAVLLAGCTSAPSTSSTPSTSTTPPEGSTTIPMPENYGPAHDFFWGLSGDGYNAYKLDHVQEGETTVVIVGVRVAPGRGRATYDAIYNHATTSAKQYGFATDKRVRLRVLLVEATAEQKAIESRDFSLAGAGG